MRMARVHLYELLCELADVPDVRTITQQRLEPVNASTASATSSS
jgi:hypothetical protein